MRFLALLLAGGTCALAQFSDIALTDDAGQIYFVSSVPLRGETNGGGGIYRWSGERFEQFVPPVDRTQPEFFRSTFRVRPVVSGGGTVVAWSDEHRCQGGSSCISNPTYWDSTIATAAGTRTQVGGRVQISRNARYVIQGQEVYIFSNPYAVVRKYRDLQSGTVTDLDFAPLGILSDGRVLGSNTNGFFLWSASGGRRAISGTAGFTSPLISDNGTRIVALRRAPSGGEPPEVVAIGVETGVPVSLGPGLAAGISNDGQRALVLSSYAEAEAWLVDIPAGTRQQVVPGSRVNSAGLAGFGHVAVLATTDGRLLRVDLDSGRSTELVPWTPVPVSSITGSPCSAVRLDGSSLTDPSEQSAVTLDGEAVAVLGASESVIWVQIPCEWQPSSPSRLLDLRTSSPFEAPVPLELREYWPELASDAVHEDFSGPVTQEQPARPGEIVHFWGTGFGPVDRPMRTGEPGPASPPARLLSPITCRDSQAAVPVEVLFAGLAPGLVGFFQLDVRVPAAAGHFVGGQCTLPGNTSFGFYMPTTAEN